MRSVPGGFLATFICFVVLFFSTCPAEILAKPVTPEQALAVAEHFLAQATVRAAEPRLVADLARVGMPSEFIVVDGGARGFVILSADDIAHPVIFYSDQNGWPDGKMPPQMQAMLEGAALEIRQAVAQAAKEAMADPDWAMLTGDTAILAPELNAVGPLVTATWSQGQYYNAMCPTDPASEYDGRAVVGCVATAMGQLMHAHQWPPTGTGTHSYIDQTYGMQSVDYAAASYDWASMPSGSLTDYNTEVAEILYHSGVSVNMEYGIHASGAGFTPVVDALRSYFRYAAGPLYMRGNFSDADWLSMLRAEFDAGRPVVYAAYTPESAGHAFILDGYEPTDYFHVNWGWDGYFNGHFYLNNLAPGPFNFSLGHAMLIGIHPLAEDGDDAFENNDTLSTAYDLTDFEAQWIAEPLGVGIQKDTDVFQIETGTSDTRVLVNCNYKQAEGDISIALYDSLQNLLTSSTTATGAEQIDYAASSSATYYVEVSGDNTGNIYDLFWVADNGSYISSDDNYEYNNLLDFAYDLSAHPATWLSNIDGPGRQFDEDWFRIQVRPDRLHLEVACSFSNAEGDIDLYIYDANGTFVGSSETLYDTESIALNLPASGYYYVRITYGNAGNAYDLWWEDTAVTANMRGWDLYR